jgi:prolyl 4-hydroxylase
MKLYIRILGFLIICLLLWFLYNYLSKNNLNYTTNTDLSPIDRCSLKYDRERVYEFDNILSQNECNMIIEMAKPKISKSAVLSKEKFHPGRTSSHVFLPSNHQLLEKIDNIVYSYLGIPKENYENLQVVNYKSTEKYDAHYDACDPKEEICKNDINTRGGFRYATFIFYLNDNFTGGETEFPKRNIRATPKTGKAVLFFNLNDDNTDRRDKSFHAGLPPNTGEKWMCNKWIRMNPHT